jgi:hypothetical protein
MFGNQIGTLELLIYNQTNNTIETSTSIDSLNNQDYTVIWSKTGRQINDWVYGNITLPIGKYIVN